MYISGSVNDLGQRIHVASTTGDLASYITEGRVHLTGVPLVLRSGVYLSGVLPQTSGAWEKELRLQSYRLTQSVAALNTQQL
jgi:hypothetical protein